MSAATVDREKLAMLTAMGFEPDKASMALLRCQQVGLAPRAKMLRPQSKALRGATNHRAVTLAYEAHGVAARNL